MHAVLDDIGNAADARRYDRHAAGHRFQHADRQRLDIRGQDEEIHEPEDVVAVVSMSEEQDLVLKSELVGECLKQASERTIPRDDELCGLSMVLQDPGCPQEHVEPFDRHEAAHRADNEVVLIQSKLFSEVRRIPGSPNLVDVDRVVDARHLVDSETRD